jgi:hypothetical protein
MLKPYLDSHAEFFDRSAVPEQIAELWQQWPDLDPSTVRLVRAAMSSRDRSRMQLAWEMLKARAELAAQMR